MRPFCNLHSRTRTHAVFVIDLYELLGNPTTELNEPPGSFNLIGQRFMKCCRQSFRLPMSSTEPKYLHLYVNIRIKHLTQSLVYKYCYMLG